MSDKLEKYFIEQERQERLEHRDVLLSISSIIKTEEGRKLFTYLFKSFEVANVPPKGLEGIELHDHLGFLRAGNSIYKLACQAASETAASILAHIERKRYEDEHEQYRLSTDTSTTDSEN